MTAYEYRLNGSAETTQGRAVIMALIAVLALGLMGFAMGYAKAGRSPLATRATHVAMPGVAAARVSLVTPGESQMAVAAVEPVIPAPVPRLARAVKPVVLEVKPEGAPSEAVAAPQQEPAITSEPATPAPEAV